MNGVDQSQQATENVQGGICCTADRIRRFEAETTGEHSELVEQRALAGVQQVVTPRNRRGESLLTGQSRAASASQELKPPIETCGKLSNR